MNELETAIKYGVPTHETCKELDWKGETNFYWYEINDNCFAVVSKDALDYGYFTEIAPAPQMHEIMAKLPIYTKGVRIEIKGSRLTFFGVNEISEYLLSSADSYVEALAKLYIKLENKDEI